MSPPVERTCTKLEPDRLGLVPSDSMPLDHYRAAAAYVLLGDPGSGKTTAFRSECEELGESAVFISARDFLVHPSSPPEWRGKTLFIDGLDEVRAGSPDARGPFDIIRSRLLEMGKPRFRISCRGADWFGENDRKRLAYVSNDSRLTVLRLDPLTPDDEWRILANLRVEDPVAFIERAGDAGLDGLLQNPQSLELLVKATEHGQDWPPSRLKAFEMACVAMVSERNRDHQSANQASAPIGTELLIDCAGHLSAIQLISDLRGYSLAGDPSNHDCAPLNEIDSSHQDALRAAVASNVFTSTGEHCFSPIHRRVAEFLGGKHLARLIDDGLPARRVLALMTGGDGTVVTALRGLSGWLAAHSAQARADLIGSDPVGVGLYGDADAFSTEDKRNLQASLLQDPKRLAEAWGGTAAFSSLAEADASIRQILDTPERNDDAEDRVEFVLQILRHGEPIPDVCSRLIVMVRDDTWSSQLRELALEASMSVPHESLEQTGLLEELLAAIRRGEVSDPFRELSGRLLKRLYPKTVGPRRVWNYLSEQVETSRSGSYWTFWTRCLEQQSSDDDVAELLDSLATQSSELDPAIERLSLRGKVIGLLRRGIRVHGHAVETERLYRWLEVGSRASVRQIADSPEASRWIRDWLEGRSDVKRELVEMELRELGRAGEASPKGYTFANILFGAAPPDNFGLRCLERSVELAPTNEQVAIQLFTEAYWAFKTGAFAKGLSSEVLYAHARQTERLESLFKSLEAPGWSPVAGDDWEQHREAYLQRERKQRNEWLDWVRSNQCALSENRCTPTLIHQLALVYFNETLEIHGSDHGQEAIARVLGEACLVNAAMDGLRHCVERNDIPSSQEIARLSGELREHLLGLPLMACLEERERQSPGFLQRLDDRTVRTFIACYHRRAPTSWQVKGNLPEWYQPLLDAMPEVVSQVAVQCAKAASGSGQELGPAFWGLLRNTRNHSVRRDVALAVLEAWPVRCNQRQLYELDRLLWVVIRHCAKAEFLSLAKRRLSLKSMMPGQRVHWLAAGLIFSSSEYGEDLLQFTSGRERLVPHLAAFYTAPGSSEGGIHEDLDSRALGILIGLLGTFHGSSSLMERGWVTDDQRASEFLLNAIRKLGSMPDRAAGDALRSFVDAPELEGWRPHLADAERNQRIARRDSDYRHPTLAEVSETLRRGKPANPADLAAIAADRIRQIAERIRTSNTNDWRQYWNLGKHGKVQSPKIENDCRDALLSDLKQGLPDAVDAEPEAAHANSARPDIELRSGKHRVPVEVKKNDAVDLWTAARDQLIDKYTLDPATGGNGIYLVFWFGSDLQRWPPDGVSPRSPLELEDRLRESLSDVERRTIVVCAVDVSAPQ